MKSKNLISLFVAIALLTGVLIYHALMQGDKPRRITLPQTTVDSIATAIETAYANAYNKSDTAALATILPKKTITLTQAGTMLNGADTQLNLLKKIPGEVVKTKVDKAEALDERLIIVRGTSTNTKATSPTVYTHVLREQNHKWQIVAAQQAYPAVE